MRAYWLVLVALNTACRIGPSIGNYQAAASPAGAAGVVRVGRSSYSGELLEVGDTAFIMRAAGGITLIPYRVITSVRFDEFTSSLPRASDFTPARLRRVRLSSRFPYGLSSQTLRQLLEQHGQTNINRAGDR